MGNLRLHIASACAVTAFASVGVVGLVAPELAAADPTQADSTSGPASDQLQEVVVTAERRSENLQTTSIAATVLNADELVQKGVVQMQDLQTASPSLSISPAGLTASVNIRGI